MTDTILHRIVHLADCQPQRPAIESLGCRPLSYEGLRGQIQYVASALSAIGIGKRDRVAIILPNGTEMAVACLGAMSCAVAAPLNPEYRAEEFAVYLSSISPKAIICLQGGICAARDVAQRMGLPVIDLVPAPDVAVGIFRLRADSRDIPGAAVQLNEANDVALLMHTSGTTSVPKRAVLTHGNLLASALNLAGTLRLGESDVCLHLLPMFHIGGLIDVLAAPLLTGGKVVCTAGFSIPAFVENLELFKPTWTQTVPVMLQEILRHAHSGEQPFRKHSLRLMRSVSSPLPVEAAREFESMFDIPVIEIFGMTETAGQISSNPLPPAPRKHGSVGIPIGCEVRIIDESGRSLPSGSTGEIVVCGSNVMARYDESDEINERSYFGEWLRTGDVGYFDRDGYLYLSGRIKEVINRGGEKIAPVEVDRVICAHPAVLDAASFAIPHETLGEDIAVAVVRKPGMVVLGQEIAEHAGGKLAYFKVPRKVYFVDGIPRTPSGKIQRHKVAEIALAMEKDHENEAVAFAEAKGPIEQALAAMWATVLKAPRIGVNDNFFDLGGDSLKAAGIINEIQRKWGATVYVSALFEAPTIRQFKLYLERHYPEVLGKALGRQVVPKAFESGGKVDDAKLTAFRASIARTVGADIASARAARGTNKRAVFILSPPRSGSTLLRAMLAGNPKLFAPPELYLLSFDTLADRKAWFSGSQRFQLEGNTRCVMQLRDVGLQEAESLISDLETGGTLTSEYYGMLQDWMGERLLVDKTPYYASDIQTLRRAEAYFDEPLYIHLKRHPYGMIRSFEEAKLDQLWYPRLVGVEAANARPSPFTRRELAEMLWVVINDNIVKFLSDIQPQRQFSMRFEDLVSDPERTTRSLCHFLGVDYTADMLDPQSKRSERMTDGTHSVSRMIGDMKFHQHKGISAGAADLWKQSYDVDFLSDRTKELAEALGYTESVSSARKREVFEF